MNLKEKLEYHYKAFDKSKISPDPLEYLHCCTKPEDVEAMGYIASIFAYGSVRQINNTLGRIFTAAEGKPYNFILNFNKLSEKKLNGIVHRFYSNQDIISLFYVLKRIYNEEGMLKNIFLKHYNPVEPDLRNPITVFSLMMMQTVLVEEKKTQPTLGVRFMFPFPDKGSACKRMNLFLRWMVRKDGLDFGLWNEIPPSKLVIPVDTHVARVCKELKLTTLKQTNWKMAAQITDNLRRFDPVDPVKYDFAICHIGMRKLKF